MPHFLNIVKIKPLDFIVTDGLALSTALASMQLTRIPESPLHVQPLVVRFADQSVAACFFERDGTFLHSTQLLPATTDPKKTSTHVPEEVLRIPIAHIHPDPSLIARCMELKQANKPISTYNAHFHHLK